ncbi:MAG: methionine biosynthesis protein MetW, partial [Desulfobacterales bacterium]
MRYDLQIIASWIEPGSHVLDLGCGNGALLKYLIKNKQV